MTISRTLIDECEHGNVDVVKFDCWWSRCRYEKIVVFVAAAPGDMNQANSDGKHLDMLPVRWSLRDSKGLDSSSWRYDSSL